MVSITCDGSQFMKNQIITGLCYLEKYNCRCQCSGTGASTSTQQTNTRYIHNNNSCFGFLKLWMWQFLNACIRLFLFLWVTDGSRVAEISSSGIRIPYRLSFMPFILLSMYIRDRDICSKRTHSLSFATGSVGCE